MAKKHRLFQLPIGSLFARAAKFALKTQLLTIWVVLGAVGFGVGMQARPEPGTIPYEELFENMSVRSYRDAPSDTTTHFVVELAASGRVFREYDVDAGQFVIPVRGRNYRRSISGTRYPALRVRGHVDRGFWLEMPASDRRALLPEQFEEMYRTTLDFVKPVSIVTNVLSTLSGYSVGYRIATWHRSLAAPQVQERVVESPGAGRTIAREAWKRVLLEPVVTGQESDAARFASTSATQRVYTNFFKLAAADSDGFIPREVARLDSAGCVSEAHAMAAFARAVTCATQDTCTLTSADFAAVEDWAALLDRHGHWAHRSIPEQAADRLTYWGTLAWYGVAPDAGDVRRIWVGPRLIVRSGDTEGFIADEVAFVRGGSPVSWGAWLRGDELHPSGNAWTAQWMAESRQVAPLVRLCASIGRAVRGHDGPGEATSDLASAGMAGLGGRIARATGGSSTATAGNPPAASPMSARERGSEVLSSDSLWSEVARGGADVRMDSTSAIAGAASADSSAQARSATADSLVIRANMGGLGP